MPIQNREDAVEVEERISRIFAASPSHRVAEVRGLFVEVLDFNSVSGEVSLVGVQAGVSLPDAADRIAELDGVHVLYMAMPPSNTDRVRKAEVDAAAKLLANQLGDDLLLVFTNPSANQLHIILPSFASSRPTLRRMVVDKDLPRRTAVQQVSNIYWNHQASGSIRTALEAAFDVEPVTRDFFAEYKRIFDVAETNVSGFQDTAEGREEKRFFVQTLFNRLMFVYFLQRKGWLTFHGNKDYLNAFWQDYHAQPKHGDFYTTRLQPLFFSGLNNPDSRDLTQGLETLIGDVPFLNGGLFEQTDLDRRKGIDVSDRAFEQVLKDLFDRFNFTVMESTPFDIEVAVDPEMLGKVFEELVTGRHDSGAYYTPRPVVSFMCREALKSYLEGRDTGADADAVARFVDQRDPAGISLAAARRISQALSEVTAVDPACGSGAYLLGMMQELIELQNTLYNVGVDAKSLYDLKLEIIQRNLYGVDIDDFAVNIAMLRLWLSLAIEYDEDDNPPPLPNLDFKVLCGDSLLGPDPSVGLTERNDETSQIAMGREPARMARLDSLKAQFLRATGSADKDRLRGEIDEIKRDLREALGDASSVPEGAVDWRVEFAEVFAQRQGFDVAIANPPYGITVTDRRSAAISHTDSYTNFMGLAVNLAPEGVMAYITPTSWETGERFNKFRQYLFSKMAVQSLVNLPYNVFDTPYVDTAITIAAVGQQPSKFRLATLDKRAELDLTQIPEYMTMVDWSAVDGDASLRMPLLDWAADLFGRVGANATPLGKITSSKRGIEAYKFETLRRSKSDAFPFFTGQVRRYELQASLSSSFVVVSNRDSQYHEGPRIWTRRIVSRANRLMSALAYEDYVVKKDIYVSKPSFDDAHRIEALLAILNSSLISFLYLSRSAAAVKDDFRQVTLAGLRELPIVFPDADTMAELAKLVSARERQDGNVEELERQIDVIIYRTYGVTEGEQEAIAEWLARPG